jgi:hypothetical protein
MESPDEKDLQVYTLGRMATPGDFGGSLPELTSVEVCARSPIWFARNVRQVCDVRSEEEVST